MFKKAGFPQGAKLVYGFIIVVTLLGFWVAYQFVEPAPPDHIVISSGSESGAYYLFAQRYKEFLARNGITLEIRTSAGSVENIARLKAPESDVDLAFVQGGTGDPGDQELLSLGSLYYEPLWLFYRSELQLHHISDLRGKKIAIGPEGSGTRAVALKLTADNKIEQAGTVLEPLGGEEAALALEQGEIDGLFMIAGAQSPIVQKLLTAEGISLLDFERAEAYERKHLFLSSVVLPEGVIDLSRNIPPADITLLAATATLVVRNDFHPALVDLILRAAEEIHNQSGLFEAQNEFPSPKHVEYKLSAEAQRYFKRGPSFLHRYLPFWLATFIDRMLVMIIPLVALLVPLIRILPPAYRWRARSGILRWYKAVKAIDLSRLDNPPPAKLRTLLSELDAIEERVNKRQIPLSFMDQVYDLRMHIALVRGEIKQALNSPDAD